MTEPKRLDKAGLGEEWGEKKGEDGEGGGGGGMPSKI
jgi:hypothetical protein